MNTGKRWWVLPLVIAIVAALAVAAIGIGMILSQDTVEDHLFYETDAIGISSPNGSTQLILTVEDGQLSYRVERDGNVFMRSSPLGVTIDTQVYGQLDSIDRIGDITGKVRTDTRTVNGRVAVADDPCVQALIPIDDDDAFTLEARVFDNGVAFRYILPGEGVRSLKSEQTAFYLPTGSTVWAGESHKYYETINKYWDPSRYSNVDLGAPITVKLEDGGYAAVMEGALVDYPGIKLEWLSKYCYGATFDASGSFTVKDTVTTPWRIITVAQDLNELVNNTMIYQVCDAADDELYDSGWVKPGRAAWSWITGRTTDRVTPALMEEYTVYAAKLGFEYNIIDEGWVNWTGYEAKLTDLAALGDDYGVGQILWTGVAAGAGFEGGIDSAQEAYAYLDLLSDLNMAGGKIDFFPAENDVDLGVNLYRDILAYAAQKELVINFHGCNKPTGLDATYPNELNREAILGLESTQIVNRKAQAQMFVTQPFVRNLAGHADYTPAVDTAFHMAQLVLTDAPMQAIGSDPADILESDALEMIKSVPTVWQETVVLPQSNIGKSAVIARKGNNGSWYVGGINYSYGDQEITLDLSLFLGEGSYRCELWTDGENGFETTVDTVTAADTLTIPFEQLDGFIVRFDRITLSQYGGEIDPDNPVTVTVTDPDTKIAYTLDGSEPGLFADTLQDGDTLTLKSSCTLTIKITGGDDKGLVTSYRFNLIE